MDETKVTGATCAVCGAEVGPVPDVFAIGWMSAKVQVGQDRHRTKFACPPHQQQLKRHAEDNHYHWNPIR